MSASSMIFASNRGTGKHPNPFNDVASGLAPIDLRSVLAWCEYIYLTFGTFRSASRRVVRYFLTEVVLEGESESERKDVEEFLLKDLKLMTHLAQAGDNLQCYGNALISVYFPYIRVLECPACHSYHNVDKFKPGAVHYDHAQMSYTATCPKCKKHNRFKWSDRRSPEKSDVTLIHWNPHEIIIEAHPVTGKCRYFWQIPPELVQKVQKGDLYTVRHTPRSILKCIKEANGHQPYFEFSDDAIFHMKDTSLAGVSVVGWGIPALLPNFKLIYYIQVLRRLDEAIAHDFIVPFRILSPAVPKQNSGMGNDPLMAHSLTLFSSSMQNMVTKHRKDPTTIQVTPYPVQAQTVGGEGKALTPSDQIAGAIEELLNAMDYPAELYRGNLSVQTSPVALRLFEKSWGTMVDGNNDLIAWILGKVTKHFMWGDISGHMQSVTLADDLERKALNLQAAAGMDISKATAYRPFKIDFLEEQQRVVEEQQAISKLQQKAQEEAMAQSGLDGGSSGGGGGPATTEATPGDVHEQARGLAQQLLFQTPETLRRGELIKIKHSNPTLHALVIQEMDQARQDMRSQGGAMMMEQTKQEMGAGGGGMVATAAAPVDTPSAVRIGLLVAQEVCEFGIDDLTKVAAAAVEGPQGDPARQAFHYMYSRLRGWE